jgi:hypothetical protein
MILYNGTVASFDSDTYVYRVFLEGFGAVYATQLITGAERRFVPKERVVCGKSGDRWVLFGALPTVQQTVDEKRQMTPEEAIASITGNIVQKFTAKPGIPIPSFRNFNDNIPTSSGDAFMIPRPLSGSKPTNFIRAYEFGSIELKSSAGCFQYFDFEDREITTVAQGFITKGPGYYKTLTFKTSPTFAGDVVKKLVLREEVRADPLNESKERDNGTEAKLDRETIEGFIAGPGGDYAKGPAELFYRPQAKRGRREVLSDYLVTEHDHDTQTVRRRLDRVDRANKTRSLEIFHAEGYLTKEGPGLAVHGSRTIFRDWGLLEFDTDVGRMLLKVRNKTIVVDQNSISLMAGNESAIHITDSGIVLKSKSVVIDSTSTAINCKQFGVQASSIAMDSDITSITANFAIIERAWGAHLTSGSIMMNSAMMIHHNTFTLTSLAQDIGSILTDVKNLLSGVVTLNPDKLNVVMDKVFANFKAVVDFTHSIASDAVQAAGILSKGFVDVAVGPGGVLPGVATGITTFLRDPTVTLERAGTFASGIVNNAIQESFSAVSYTAVSGISVATQTVNTFSDVITEVGNNIKNISDAIEKVQIDIPNPVISLSEISIDTGRLTDGLERAFNAFVEIPESAFEQVITSAEAAGKQVGGALGNLADAAKRTAEAASTTAVKAGESVVSVYEAIASGPPTITSPTFNQSIAQTTYLDPNIAPWANPTISYAGSDIPPELYGVVPQ